ncbi:hypothetical protein HELRODRAFT_180750 [Helobdella robusta]|uniref:Uncharacterized protein n=1 Tax=Helobdella robusta TaxID=6412 RepID=T1FG85_HELRO|nr:hypothetical protein HELRODRAFT_180750 [Helobdella robusta]ESN93658.1 hypothetical protein HELRODRAFT_180750 [Helobdella robusta]
MSSENSFKEISSKQDFDTVLKESSASILVLHFSADWAAQCKQIKEVLFEIKQKLQRSSISCIQFAEIQAEKFPEISKKYGVEAVPTCLIIKDLKEAARINGANVAELVSKIEEFASCNSKSTQSLNDRLKSLITQAPVMVFMKGSPDTPRCGRKSSYTGFSKTLVQLLNEQGVQFKSFDILNDESIRQGLKEYSNWPTYPQVYING